MLRKRLFALSALASMLLCSCAEKPEDSMGDGQQEETPSTPETPADTLVQEEEFRLIAPIFDMSISDDGSAADKSASGYRINSYPGYSMLAWRHPDMEGNMLRFCHIPGGTATDAYHKFNYYGNTKFKNRLSDGYSIEVICMFDAAPQGLPEVKLFSSMEQGGTGIMISDASKGNQLTFLTNVSTTGSSNWIWGTSGVTPQRGRYYHIIGVWDKEKGEARVYVDGQLRNTVRTSGDLVFPKASCHWFCIGGDPGPSDMQAAWRGDIALARIYDEALTEDYISKYHAQEISLAADASIQPEDIMYMTACNVAEGGIFKIAGSGFQEGDILRIVASDGSYVADCRCEVTAKGLNAELPGGLQEGRHKLFIARGNETYPFGEADFTISEEAAALKAPGIIAHRGYHKNGIPENSIAALAKAQELEVYGSEVDVWITLDSILVCNHDGVLGGKKLQDCTYEQIRNLTLSNGEKLPTFEAMLEQLKKSGKTKLILEFKQHSNADRDNAAVDEALRLIDMHGLAPMIEYIAFDYATCKRVAAAKPDAMVGYLNGDKDPESVFADGIRCIDYNSGILKNHSGWISKAHELGMKVNVWTVNADNDLMYWISEGVDYITTDNPDRLALMIDTFCQD